MATPPLKSRMPALDAFVLLADTELDRVSLTLRALSRRDHPEDLHQLRIALRRLRVLRWLFAPALPRSLAARWRQTLDDMMAATGTARDWDVLIEGTLQPALVRQPHSPVLRGLLEEAIRRRDAVHRALLAELVPYRQNTIPMLQRELELLRLAPVREGTVPFARTPLRKFAVKRVRKARRRWRALKPGPEHRGPEAPADLPADFAALFDPALHARRIAGKRLRYAIEAVYPVLPRRYRGPLHRKLVRRQDRLGHAVDAAAARRLIATLVVHTVRGRTVRRPHYNDLRQYAP